MEKNNKKTDENTNIINKNVNEIDYISIDNLELLYSNIRNFFFDIHKLDILNYSSNIKEILFENMKLIYSAKYASTLKTKELNIITLKNIKEILEKEITKKNINQNNNVDIINRENQIYNRKNENKQAIVSPLNNGTFNMEINKNLSKDYDKLLNDRNDSLPKKEIVNFSKDINDNISKEQLNNNMKSLIEERETFLKDIISTNESKTKQINNVEKSNIIQSKDIIEKNNIEQNNIEQNNNNGLIDLEGFSIDDDNFGSLFNEYDNQNQNIIEQQPIQQLPIQQQPIQQQPLQQQPLQKPLQEQPIQQQPLQQQNIEQQPLLIIII